jgi:HSP20 family protein
MNKALTQRHMNPLTSWQKGMNRFLHQFNHMDRLGPKVEIRDKEKEYVIKAEIPGMDEKDLKVEFRQNSLIIAGERKSEKETEEKGNYRSEFRYGCFFREIPLDQEVDSEHANARYKNGVLTVHLAKTGKVSSRAKTIPISLS